MITIDELGDLYNEETNRKRDGVRFVMCGDGMPLPPNTWIREIEDDGEKRWITAGELSRCSGLTIMNGTKLRPNGFEFEGSSVHLVYEGQLVTSIEFSSHPGMFLILTETDAHLVDRFEAIKMVAVPVETKIAPAVAV